MPEQPGLPLGMQLSLLFYFEKLILQRNQLRQSFLLFRMQERKLGYGDHGSGKSYDHERGTLQRRQVKRRTRNERRISRVQALCSYFATIMLLGIRGLLFIFFRIIRFEILLIFFLFDWEHVISIFFLQIDVVLHFLSLLFIITCLTIICLQECVSALIFTSQPSTAILEPLTACVAIIKLFSSELMLKGKRSKQEVQEASLLISDFTDQSQEKRVASAKNLRFIAEVLGGDRVKSELIPFLREEVIYDDSAVVLELLNGVECLGEVIGGGIACTWVLPLLEDGLEYEQQKVRKRAVEKYYELVHSCDLQKCQNPLMQSLRKLHSNEYDQVKEAFCCVVSRKLGLFSTPNQQELITLYLALLQDPALTRRKYAARYCWQLVQWLSCAQTPILKCIELLSKDKEESNKIHLIDAIIELSRVKTPTTLQSYFNLISYQFSWRIRYELISKIDKLAQAMGKEQFKSFLTYFIKYLNDIEPQIRSIANAKLEQIIPYLEVDDIVNRVLPALKSIPQDTHAYVRNSLAGSLLHLCPALGKKHTIQSILPKFLAFLKDQQEQQVKQTIFKKVSLICQTLGIETLSQSVLPVLDEMIAHTNWRVRAQSINILLYLIRNSPPTFVNQKIIKCIVDYLKDRASAVRKEGVGLVAKLIEQHGQAWVEKTIIPKLLPMFKSSTFLHRETILLALETLAPKLSADCLSKQIFSNVFYLAQDPVENVKMSVCLALGVLYGNLPKEKDAIKKLLRNLKDDKDNDVKEMAVKVLAKLD